MSHRIDDAIDNKTKKKAKTVNKIEKSKSTDNKQLTEEQRKKRQESFADILIKKQNEKEKKDKEKAKITTNKRTITDMQALANSFIYTKKDIMTNYGQNTIQKQNKEEKRRR